MNSISLAGPHVLIKMLEPDEDALVRAAHANPAAFVQLYRKYLTPVYRYALARVGRCAEAEDITSQTFLAALQGISHYHGQGKFSTWLFGIARNKCADYFRSNYSAREVPIEDAEEEPAQEPETEQLVEYRARLQDLSRKTVLLPTDQAEALSLRIFAGLSAREVAAVMGRSEAAVKMLIQRAVQNLRMRMGSWMEAE